MGSLIVDDARILSPQESRIAHLLVREGYQVRALAEVTASGIRTADFLVNGVRVELKTISNITSPDMSGALSRRIQEGAGQASHIIIDAGNQQGMTVDIAETAIRRVYGAQTYRNDSRIQQIRIIGDDFDITVPYNP